MLSAIKQQIDKIDVPSMPTPIRLRDLIRNIRACRTAAEEREVIQKVQFLRNHNLCFISLKSISNFPEKFTC